jgi:hypothetical protein
MRASLVIHLIHDGIAQSSSATLSASTVTVAPRPTLQSFVHRTRAPIRARAAAEQLLRLRADQLVPARNDCFRGWNGITDKSRRHERVCEKLRSCGACNIAVFWQAHVIVFVIFAKTIGGVALSRNSIVVFFAAYFLQACPNAF